MDNFIWVIGAVFGSYILLELLLGRFWPKNGSRRENLLDVLAASQAWFLAGPLVVYFTAAIERGLLPGYADQFAGMPWYLQLLAFVIADDMVQYWWHRATHKFPLLWGMHKFHHSPPFMGVRVIWRNGFFYDLLMPNLYFSGVLVYLGFGEVYFWYYLLKLCVTMGAHSELRWDAWLYKYPGLAPLAWLVERSVSTPATHFAHHAISDEDGVGNPNGNFGNLLFFWDVLFGTARITRRYPERFGVPQEPGIAPDPWYVYIFYPIFRAPSERGRQQN
ncbi:MAG: sterol desaturase family protein [Nevskiales bacterium]